MLQKDTLLQFTVPLTIQNNLAGENSSSCCVGKHLDQKFWTCGPFMPSLSGSPRPQFAKNQYVVQAQAGNYTELKMYAYAYPKAHYTWSKDDGMDLSNITNQDDFADGTTLSFPEMSVPYFGNYTLKMQNGNGTYFAHYQIVPRGKPEAPSNLRFSDVTFDSVKLQWTSGFDMGSRQQFIVLILYRDMYIQLSNWIYDNSTNYGINQNFTYVLNKLDSQRRYNLTIVSQNAMGFYSPLTKSSVAITTKQNPDDEKSSKADLKLILGLTFGILATLGLAALMVYILKYRNFKTSSEYNQNISLGTKL
ncbi:twitchin-like [Mercenaria mercenaria]|uniref:twitchin-like n=1 Tax=Mercenaria mercenaria TaxID=6596 RepID=UPI00234F9BD7|nr:twitchin-like [Mercenaria mercenaria]